MKIKEFLEHVYNNIDKYHNQRKMLIRDWELLISIGPWKNVVLAPYEWDTAWRSNWYILLPWARKKFVIDWMTMTNKNIKYINKLISKIYKRYQLFNRNSLLSLWLNKDNISEKTIYEKIVNKVKTDPEHVRVNLDWNDICARCSTPNNWVRVVLTDFKIPREQIINDVFHATLEWYWIKWAKLKKFIKYLVLRETPDGIDQIVQKIPWGRTAKLSWTTWYNDYKFSLFLPKRYINMCWPLIHNHIKWFEDKVNNTAIELI